MNRAKNKKKSIRQLLLTCWDIFPTSDNQRILLHSESPNNVLQCEANASHCSVPSSCPWEVPWELWWLVTRQRGSPPLEPVGSGWSTLRWPWDLSSPGWLSWCRHRPSWGIDRGDQFWEPAKMWQPLLHQRNAGILEKEIMKKTA